MTLDASQTIFINKKKSKKKYINNSFSTFPPCHTYNAISYRLKETYEKKENKEIIFFKTIIYKILRNKQQLTQSIFTTIKRSSLN